MMRLVEILPPIAALVTSKHGERRWILATFATLLGVFGMLLTAPASLAELYTRSTMGKYAWFIIWSGVVIFSIYLWVDYIRINKTYRPRESFQKFRNKKSFPYKIISIIFGLLSFSFVALASKILFLNISNIDRHIISPILSGMIIWLLARASFLLFRVAGGKSAPPLDPQYLSLWRGVPDWGVREPLALTSNLVNPFETPSIGHDCLLALHADGIVLLYRSESGWEPVSFEFSALSAVAMAADYGKYLISVEAITVLLRFDGGREAVLTLPSEMSPQHSFANAFLLALDGFILNASETRGPVEPLPQPQRWVFARTRPPT